MNININPFQQLYFSDDAQTEANFVELFSDEVLQSAINPVFQEGNVVLCGTQGCGKTMILNLLRPEIRIAYWDLGKAELFPVKKEMRNFVSAGINLTRSRIADLVQVTLNRGDGVDFRELAFFFSDFFNYLIVEDLIKSIETIGRRSDVFDSLVDLSCMSKFVSNISKEECWFGALDGVRSIEELKQRITQRIGLYRRWVNGNLQDAEPPELIRNSKTNIGEPIARTAECLRRSGVINADVPVLIRVDQIEEMHRAFTARQGTLLLSFRKMLNRAFAARDARVHYRAGSRRYGWGNPEFLGIWGSEARLEKRRDYLYIDMDQELFSFGESKNSVFEKFAINTFQKRISYYYRREPGIDNLKPDFAKSVFGKHPTAEERLAQLNVKASDIQIDRALGLDLANDGGNWSEEWRIFLRNQYQTGFGGMLDAVLASAWGRQTGGAREKQQHRENPPPDDAPWKNRKWWRKERLDQAVLQLSTRCQQRFMWWGFNDIRSLSGGNITVFLHICHRIWDGFLKHESSLPVGKRTDVFKGGVINRDIQSAGILFASNEWFKKLPEEPGGDSRQNFVERLAIQLNEAMMQDLRMAYPGGNGISISLTEYESMNNDVVALRNFLCEAVGYGALFATEHSSKSKTGGKRIKFYLNPILCPRFQIPEARTKEPYYLSMIRLSNLAKQARITLPQVQRADSVRNDAFPFLPGFENTKS